tara:strand:- start:83119 stop:85398 length:2280 start_codon:yes stop_codon:yes gene_type:complete
MLSCQDQTSKPELGIIKTVAKNIDYGKNWTASWITTKDDLPEQNAWISFRKKISIENTDSLIMRIATDTKYWLYINNELVVFEGGLKRGPTPENSYYDQLKISEYVEKGENTIAVLVWYFGKQGMSHNSSGKAGLLAEIYQNNDLITITDDSWKAIKNPAYISKSEDPQPNWRLPESNIVFDSNKELENWTSRSYDDTVWQNTKVLAKGISAPWNLLEERPIPFWKDFGLKEFENLQLPFVSTGDTLKLKLPYNMQFTPYLKVKAVKGQKITMLTDHYKGGSAYNMRAEYITKEGEQAYESFGWINGEKAFYVIPKGVEVLDLKYRETGYNTEFSGSFKADNSFYNNLWEKALRTLYITMRDTYMDCPDRERAQWWGDVVLESGEAFYALDRQSDALTKKGIYELMNWQRKDSTIFSPVPTGNWNNELPTQMLSSIGTFGFWNYYWHTGDKQTIVDNYDAITKYLGVWKLKEDGTLKLRKGGWTWGDWGENKDMPIIFNSQYYMALDSYARMSQLLGRTENYEATKQKMILFKKAYNQVFWQGSEYRSEDYKGKTDDRSQGLSVVSGLADADKYKPIYAILKTEKHASPYMEKYILEALFQMGYSDFALQRMEERFATMVNYPQTTTLWEGWGIGAEGYGGGTTNHAWSGGGLTLLSQYVAGVYPTSAAYDTFHIKPQLGFLKEVQAVVPCIKGNIEVEIKKQDKYIMKVLIPPGTEAEIFIPAGYNILKIKENNLEKALDGKGTSIKLSSGAYNIEAL